MSRLYKVAKILSLVLLLFVSSTLHCKTSVASQNPSIEVHKLDSFDTLAISGSYNIHLKQGKKPQIRLEGTERDIENVAIDLRNRKLYITSKEKRDVHHSDSPKLIIYITASQLEEIDIKGSPAITSENELQFENLKIISKGSAQCSLALKVNKLNVEIKGSGTLMLNGSVIKQDVIVSGSAHYLASKLQSTIAIVNIYGSGDAQVNVEKELDVKVYGSGSLFYSGNPSIQSQSYGSGKVKKL